MAGTIVTYKKGKLYQIDLAQLQSDPNQPRKYMDPMALEEMTASIVKHGVLEPILFRMGSCPRFRASARRSSSWPALTIQLGQRTRRPP